MKQKIKWLPVKLKKNGFVYKLVKRGKRSFIYEQLYDENLSYYEVFKKRIKPSRLFNGKKLPAKEWFPHNEAFGVWAWVYRTLDRAFDKFNHLEAE